MAEEGQKKNNFFAALEAWNDYANNLDDNLEKVEGEVQKPQKGTLENDIQISDMDKKPGAGEEGGEFDEANDNANVDNMLANIMDALKNEGMMKPKPKPKKKVYQPLERIVKKEEDIPKPDFVLEMERQREKERLEKLEEDARRKKELQHQSIEDFSYDQSKNLARGNMTSLTDAKSKINNTTNVAQNERSNMSDKPAQPGNRKVVENNLMRTNESIESPIQSMTDQRKFFPNGNTKNDLSNVHNTSGNISKANLVVTNENAKKFVSEGSSQKKGQNFFSEIGKGLVENDTDLFTAVRLDKPEGYSAPKKSPLKKKQTDFGFGGVEVEDYQSNDVKGKILKKQELEKQNEHLKQGIQTQSEPNKIGKLSLQDQISSSNKGITIGVLKDDENQVVPSSTKSVSHRSHAKIKAHDSSTQQRGSVQLTTHHAHLKDDEANLLDPKKIKSQGGAPSDILIEDLDTKSKHPPKSQYAAANKNQQGTQRDSAHNSHTGRSAAQQTQQQPQKSNNLFNAIKPKHINTESDIDIDSQARKSDRNFHLGGDLSPINRSREEDQKTYTNNGMDTDRVQGKGGEFDNLEKQLDKLDGEDDKFNPVYMNKQLDEEGKEIDKKNREENIMEIQTTKTQKKEPKTPKKILKPTADIDESELQRIRDGFLDDDEKMEDLSFSYEYSKLYLDDISLDEGNEDSRLNSHNSLQQLEEGAADIDVPVQGRIIQFFLWLRRKATNAEKTYKKVTSKEYTLDTFFQNCKCRGRTLTKNFFFLFLMMTILMLIFAIDTSSATSISRVQNDPERDFLAKLLIPAALIFTYYGIGILYMKPKALKWVAGSQIGICILAILIDLIIYFADDDPNAKFTYELVYICGFILFVNLFWIVARLLKNDLDKSLNWKSSLASIGILCILLPMVGVGYSIYITIIARRYDYNWAHDLIQYIGIPFIILLCFTWVYYHFKFFTDKPKQETEKQRSMKRTATISAGEQAQKDAMERIEKEDGDDEADEEEVKKVPFKVKVYLGVRSLIKKLRSSIMWSSSFLLGGFLLIIECILLDYLIQETKDGRVSSVASFYIAAFLFFFIPLFVLAGVPIFAIQSTHSKKMMWVPFIGIIIPVIILMPLARSLIDEDVDTEPIGTYCIFALPAAILFWLTISYLGMKKKRMKYGLAPFVFIFFIFPLVVLQPLISNNAFSNDIVARVFSILFLAIGGIVIAIAAAYLVSRAMLAREISKKDRLNTDNYKLIAIFKADLEPFGLWVNAAGFIICYTISLYSVFQAPDGADEGLRGAALGIALVFVLMFILNNIAINLYTAPEVKQAKNKLPSISEAIIASVDGKELAKQIRTIKRNNNRIKTTVRLTCFVIAGVSLVISLAAIAFSPFVSSMFVALLVGTLLTYLIFEIYAFIKLKYGGIARATIPGLIAYIWFDHLLILASVLHLARVFFFKEEDEGTLTRLEFLLIALDFVITMTLLAIIANIIFKGIELQQKIRYILAYLKKKMEEIAVKSDFYVLEKIFDGWMADGEKTLQKKLLNRGKPAFWWPIPATNPLEKYSKQLLDFDAFDKLQKRIDRKKKIEKGELKDDDDDGIEDQISKKKTCCAKCCNYCFPTDEDDGPEKELINMEDEIDELVGIDENDIPFIPKGVDELSESDDELDIGLELGDYQIETKVAENRQMLTNLKFEPLDPRIYRAMAYYDKGIKFSYHDKETVDFLKFVFRIFAVGNYKLFRKRWLDYLGYKKLLYLSGTIPSPEFPDYMIDLTYTLYTHNVGKGEIQRRVEYKTKKNQAQKKKERKNKKEQERDQKTRLKVFPIFEEDFEGFLTHIAKVRYPNEVNDREALFKYIRWHLFTNFLHLIEPFQKEYPHEYDYLMYLKELYMGLGKKKKGPGEDDLEGDEINAKKNDDIETINENHNHKHGKKGDEGQDGYEGRKGSVTLIEKKGFLDDGSKKPKYGCFRRFMIALCACLSGCSRCFLRLMSDLLMALFCLKTNAQKKANEEFDLQNLQDEMEEREEIKKKREDRKNQENLGDDEELNEEEMNKKGMFRRKAKTYPHKPSPEWPVIVQNLMNSLKDAENDYEFKKAAGKKNFFIPNVRNWLTLVALTFEIYAMASFAFRVEVPWGWPLVLQEALSFPSGSFDGWWGRFWSTFGFALFYCYIGYISIYFAKESVLGADKMTGLAGEFPSRGFAHSQTLIWTSTAVSVWVIKTLLDVFSCDYRDEPWVLYSNENVECLGDTHGTLFGLASLGIVLYYPLASFLYPNLQYLNKGNDFKHDTSFVVILNQIKLVIITLNVFFPFEDEVPIPMIGSAVCFIALALFCKLIKPNVVKALNIWFTSFFFMGFWFYVSAIVVYYSGSTPLATTVLLVGFVGILVATIVIHKLWKKGKFDEPEQKEKENSDDDEDEKTTNKSRTNIDNKGEENAKLIDNMSNPEGSRKNLDGETPGNPNNGQEVPLQVIGGDEEKENLNSHTEVDIPMRKADNH